ncbi:MAG: FtsX-like permease family protein, partial [Calditrichota bacterium]
ANVILRPEPGENITEGVAVSVHQESFNGHSIQVATTAIPQLLKLNPAWLVRGKGRLLAGQKTAQTLGLHQDDQVNLDGTSRQVAILESGTDFDSFLLLNGPANNPDMVLLRSEHPEQYRGRQAVILQEMVASKYRVLASIKRLMLSVGILAAVAAIATVLNLARVDAAQRRRELGVFKSLGASKNLVNKIIGTEFFILAAISTVLGFLGSVGLGWVILSGISPTSPKIPAMVPVVLFGTALVAFMTAGMIYYIESKRHLVIEALRGE